MRVFGIFGMLFGGTKEEIDKDREILKAEVEEEVDFIAITAANRVAEWRESFRGAKTLEVEHSSPKEGKRITGLSHDAPVLQPAASKTAAPEDFSKLKGAKLRQAYRGMFEEEPDGRWSEATIRGLLAKGK